MSESQLFLLGVGGAGARIVRGIRRAFGAPLRCCMADTDAATSTADEPFILIGGSRLSGRGAGGSVLNARMAVEDSLHDLDAVRQGARLAVVVAGLGGGTGGGATLEIVRYFRKQGLPSIVFATTPFAFEGEERQRTARGMMPMIVQEAAATFFMPLDQMVDGHDNMDEALRHAVDTVASAVTLFWRLLESPGYIRIDVEQLRQCIGSAGRGRFAVASAAGPDRAAQIVEKLSQSPLLAGGDGPVREILCGVLAGDDLRLSEIARLAEGVRARFGASARFTLGTVNDERAFSGRLAAVLMLFEGGDTAADGDGQPTGAGRRAGRRSKELLSRNQADRGRFQGVEPTYWHGEDLDVPTYLRKGITLDF